MRRQAIPDVVRIEFRVPAASGMLCACPTCQALDARYPGEGRQLALFPYGYRQLFDDQQEFLRRNPLSLGPRR